MASQVEKLGLILGDLNPHRSDLLVMDVYGDLLSLARLAARIYDLKKRLPPQFTIRSWADKYQRTLTWYQQVPIEAKAKPDGELFPRRFGVTG